MSSSYFTVLLVHCGILYKIIFQKNSLTNFIFQLYWLRCYPRTRIWRATSTVRRLMRLKIWSKSTKHLRKLPLRRKKDLPR